MNSEKETILLVDENGVECEFEIAQVFGVEELNSEYAVVVPADSEEEEEGILLKMIEETDGSMTLATVEDEEEYDIAAQVYATLFMNE